MGSDYSYYEYASAHDDCYKRDYGQFYEPWFDRTNGTAHAEIYMITAQYGVI